MVQRAYAANEFDATKKLLEEENKQGCPGGLDDLLDDEEEDD